MKNRMEIVELSIEEIDSVNAGLAPALAGILWVGGYIGALQVAADFGRGLGRGFYRATHLR